MAADKILSKIEQDANADVEAINAESGRKVKEAALAIEKSGSQKIAGINAAADEECAEIKRRAELLGKLETRKAQLASKREVIDSAFELAAKTMCMLDDARWEQLIIKLAVSAAETGEETLRVNEADKPRYAGGALLGAVNAAAKLVTKEDIVPAGYNMLAKINDALKAKGKAGRMTLDENCAPITGGVIIAGKASETDCSFEALVRDMRRDCEKDVSKLLFGEV